MHLAPTSLLLLLVAGSCATSAPEDGIAERLAAIRPTPQSLKLARDTRGTVVLCMGSRLAIQVDPGAGAPEWPWSMSIFDDNVYKGEFEPVERVGDHLLGFLVKPRAGQVVQVGDHAWCNR
jgi:hypothetical protein